MKKLPRHSSEAAPLVLEDDLRIILGSKSKKFKKIEAGRNIRYRITILSSSTIVGIGVPLNNDICHNLYLSLHRF